MTKGQNLALPPVLTPQPDTSGEIKHLVQPVTTGRSVVQLRSSWSEHIFGGVTVQ